MALMSWHIVTRDQFDAGTPIDGHMYFITGENTIYRGENGTVSQYNKAIEFYTTTLPTSPAPYRLYVDTVTFAGKMWDGSKWNDVIKPLADTVSAELKSFFAKNERKVYIVGTNIVDYVRCACICAAAEDIVHYQQKGRFSDRVVACIGSQDYT